MNNGRNASVVQWSEFLAIGPEVLDRVLVLPDFLKSNGFGTGYTEPREYK
jgi:hypothetical protein